MESELNEKELMFMSKEEFRNIEYAKNGQSYLCAVNWF